MPLIIGPYSFCLTDYSVTILHSTGRLIIITTLIVVFGTTGPRLLGKDTLKKQQRVSVPVMSDLARKYYHTGNFAWLTGILWRLMIPAAILWTGLSMRLYDMAQKLARTGWYFTILFYLSLYTLFTYLAFMPLAFYLGFMRQHAYGLSNQPVTAWLRNYGLEMMVTLIAYALFLWIPYLIIHKSPHRWWIYTSLLAAPFMFFIMLIQPIFIAPLFNNFGPMKDKHLETAILNLASQCGINDSRVFEVDKSRDTKAVNAYVTGLGQTKRIVLWDTLIEKLNDKEVLFVMGHEMGHYVLGHVIRSILLGILSIPLLLYGVHFMARRLICRFQQQWGFKKLGHIASFPLLQMLFSICLFIGSPMGLMVSRYHEREADRFALELTQNNTSGATAFVQLQSTNLGNPRPGKLYTFWRGSHPSLGDRIDFCNEYRPWESDLPLRYSRYFQKQVSSSRTDPEKRNTYPK